MPFDKLIVLAELWSINFHLSQINTSLFQLYNSEKYCRYTTLIRNNLFPPPPPTPSQARKVQLIKKCILRPPHLGTLLMSFCASLMGVARGFYWCPQCPLSPLILALKEALCCKVDVTCSLDCLWMCVESYKYISMVRPNVYQLAWNSEHHLLGGGSSKMLRNKFTD